MQDTSMNSVIYLFKANSSILQQDESWIVQGRLREHVANVQQIVMVQAKLPP